MRRPGLARPSIADLCSGAGGAGTGYHRAGFRTIVGVDCEPQPNYPFTFVQADALEFLESLIAGDGRFGYRLEDFDGLHGSWPCQKFSRATPAAARERHADLLTPGRKAMNATGLPWVIENVPGAPMRVDYRLCGCMFPECGRLRRERWFETSWHGFDMRPACHHPESAITITTKGQPNRTGYAPEAKQVMGIDWMSQRELGLAIPPVYTEVIGRHLLEHIATAKAAA